MTTFANCATALSTNTKLASSVQTTASNAQAASAILTYFEAQYYCSGICMTPLFYYSLTLDNGFPKKACLLNIFTELSNSLLYLGAISLGGGFIMSMIWCCQYALWRTYEDEQE